VYLEDLLLYNETFDSMIYHILNSVLAETDYIPWTPKTDKKDPTLRFYKPKLFAATENHWSGSGKRL